MTIRAVMSMLRCGFLLPLLLWLALPLAAAQEQATAIASIESALRSRQYDQALLLCQSALHQKPADFRVWTLKGIALSMKGDRTAALAAFHQALELSPEYPAALKAEAQLLYQAGDSRAGAVLQKIVKTDPGDQTAQEMLGLLKAKQNQCSSANEHFRLSGEAIDSHPGSLERYGYCLMQLRQLEQAIPVSEKLVALEPERAYARYDLALIQRMANRNEQAVESLQPLIAVKTEDPEILSLASEAEEAAGDTPDAVSLLRQAIVLNPTDADYYARFAALCLNHDSFQVGIDMLNAGLERIPGNPSLYISRGLLYSELAQYDKAATDFVRAEQLDPAQGLSSYALGLAEMQGGHPEQALATIESRIKEHPKDATLHYLLARVLMEQGAEPGSAAFQRATNSALLAVRLKPDLLPARDLLASIYLKAGRNALAIEQCRLALEIDPANQSALYHLIMASRSSGDKEQLQAMVKRFSALQQEARRQENNKRRYKLVEESPPSNP